MFLRFLTSFGSPRFTVVATLMAVIAVDASAASGLLFPSMIWSGSPASGHGCMPSSLALMTGGTTKVACRGDWVNRGRDGWQELT
jgi:hypothetical protein